MKIVIVSRGFPTKDAPLNGIFEFDQAKALAANGHDVYFMALDYRKYAENKNFGKNYFTHECIKIYQFSLPTGIYRRLMWLQHKLCLNVFNDIVKENGMPDIVHAHFYFMCAIASCIKKKYSNIKFVITEHSSKLNKALNEISDLDKSLVLKAYQYTDCRIAVSSKFADRLKLNFNYEFNVVHNIVDLSAFKFIEKVNNSNSNFVFITLGRLIKLKNFDLLIRSFANANFNSNVKLKIIGSGPEQLNLELLIKSLNCETRVELSGQLCRYEIANELANSNAFVLLSDSETFGVSFIEAMAMGLPVISSKCGGPEDFINDSNGILVSVNNIHESIKALNVIYTNISKYNNKLISKNCEELFSSNIIANQIVQLYKI